MSSVGDFFSAWGRAMNARDAVGIASLCVEDVVWEDSALIGAGPSITSTIRDSSPLP
jgi:ketosteroid isomerase-like protein